MKKHLALFLMVLLFQSPAWSEDEWLKTRPALTGDQWTAWPAASQANNKSIDRLLANYREGMTLSYSSATTVSVSAGEVMCSNAAGDVRKMRQNTSATNVTFADIDTGSERASTTYYLYACADADETTATFKISASSTAPTGVTYYKRLGSFYNDASSNITVGGISNDSNYFDSTVGTLEVKSNNTTYQALTDGYFTAILRTTPSVSHGVIQVFSDSSSSPSTLRCEERTYYAGDGGTCTIPVKRGDYYKGVLTATAGTPVATYHWIPIGN